MVNGMFLLTAFSDFLEFARDNESLNLAIARYRVARGWAKDHVCFTAVHGTREGLPNEILNTHSIVLRGSFDAGPRRGICAAANAKARRRVLFIYVVAPD